MSNKICQLLALLAEKNELKKGKWSRALLNFYLNWLYHFLPQITLFHTAPTVD